MSSVIITPPQAKNWKDIIEKMLTLAQELGMTEEELNSVHSYGDLVEIIDELKDLDLFIKYLSYWRSGKI